MKSSGRFPIVWWMEESMKALWAIEMFFPSAYIFPFAFDHFERSGTLPAWIETLVLFSRSLGFGVLFSINQRVGRHYPKETCFFLFPISVAFFVELPEHWVSRCLWQRWQSVMPWGLFLDYYVAYWNYKNGPLLNPYSAIIGLSLMCSSLKSVAIIVLW